VDQGAVDLGIIICGSGNGASMTANKHQKVRAALCWNNEIVTLAREHNDANILSLPARFISLPQALDMVKTFLETKFAGGRHERRVEKIPCS
jgi:ribose 5-phosphate isomerase B